MYLEQTAVVVEDHDRAIDIFVNGLGFELLEDSPDRTSVGGRADDFDAAYARMTKYGVEFEGEPRSGRYGQVVVSRDVAGNRWDLLGPRP